MLHCTFVSPFMFVSHFVPVPVCCVASVLPSHVWCRLVCCGHVAVREVFACNVLLHSWHSHDTQLHSWGSSADVLQGWLALQGIKPASGFYIVCWY